MTRKIGSAGVFTTDAALIVRSWDAWLTEATGLSDADACGRAIVELFPELAERGLLDRLRRVADAGVVEVLAPAFHRYLIPCPPRGSSAHFARMQQHVTIAPLHADGAIIGVAVTIEDVTSRLDLERELAEQLGSANDAVRLQAARRLGALDTAEDAVAPLTGALGDVNWRVRRAAAEGLARGNDQSAVDALVASVRDRHRDPALLNAALTALVRARRDVVPAVLALLEARESDADVRTYATLALGLLEDRRAVPALLRALDDADPNVCFHAVEALGRVRSREAADRLAAIAESRDFSVAFAALDALALIGEPSVAYRIVPLLDDELLQTAAVEALGRLGAEDVVAPLAALLDRPGAPVIEVAGALATLHARLEEHDGESRLVADLARPVLTPAAAAALVAAVPPASDEQLVSIAVVLGWLDADGLEETLAGMLAKPRVRRRVADILAGRGARAVPALLAVLELQNAEATKAAAAALGQIGSPAAVPALLSLLDAEPEVAVVAAGALGGIGDQRAFEPLVARLDHPQPAVRHALVAALNSIGHPAMPIRVHALLSDASPRLREAGAKIAGYFGYPDCVERMLALCDDENDAVRRVAVEHLAHLDDPRALAVLTAAVRAGTPGVRAAAARGLAHVAPYDALPGMIAAFGDPDPWVRYYSARSAGHHRIAGTAMALATLASADPVPPVRIAAIESLAALGSESVAETLRSLADDPDPTIARAGLAALAELPGETAMQVLLRALQSEDPERRMTALAGLSHRGQSGAPEAIAALARSDGEGEVRVRAVEALGRIGEGRALDALIDLAADRHVGTRVVAVLSGLAERQVPAVAAGLRHPDIEVRCAVVEALARMRHRVASARIAEALGDDAAPVRLAAAQALGRLDVREADATLATLARTDRDPGVRRAAQGALAR